MWTDLGESSWSEPAFWETGLGTVEGASRPITASDVRGVVVHTDLRRTGWFRCSDDRINRLHEAAVWSVALDFGRITINPSLIVYLFGTPGQERFRFMWQELASGAIGGVVLADTRKLDSCFASVDFFERFGIPFVVGVNCFDGADRYTGAEVRDALDLDDHVPIALCDVRERSSSKEVLTVLMEHVVSTAEQERYIVR